MSPINKERADRNALGCSLAVHWPTLEMTADLVDGDCRTAIRSGSVRANSPQFSVYSATALLLTHRYIRIIAGLAVIPTALHCLSACFSSYFEPHVLTWFSKYTLQIDKKNINFTGGMHDTDCIDDSDSSNRTYNTRMFNRNVESHVAGSIVSVEIDTDVKIYWKTDKLWRNAVSRTFVAHSKTHSKTLFFKTRTKSSDDIRQTKRASGVRKNRRIELAHSNYSGTMGIVRRKS